MVRVLLRGWGVPRGRKPILAAAIAHAIDPTTWVSLTRKDLDDGVAVELMSTFVGASARSSRRFHLVWKRTSKRHSLGGVEERRRISCTHA